MTTIKLSGIIIPVKGERLSIIARVMIPLSDDLIELINECSFFKMR